MGDHILITGGDGMVGKKLTAALIKKGYQVSHLSRRVKSGGPVKTYLWNIDKGLIDPNCITGVDTIIHLAGAGIADKPWTDERKKVIIESRTKSIALLYKLLSNTPHQVKNIISASAIGYYGDSGNKLVDENSAPGFSFMAECCVEWEKAVDKGAEMGLRIVKFRTGVVLNKIGGALPKLAMPISLGIGVVLGGGKQWVPWVHLQDVVDMYLMAVKETNMNGVYNMVAPFPVTNEQLTKAIAKKLHRPLWLPNVPAFALKMFLGEMSATVLASTKVSGTKIEKAGFRFSYLMLDDALKKIYE